MKKHSKKRSHKGAYVLVLIGGICILLATLPLWFSAIKNRRKPPKARTREQWITQSVEKLTRVKVNRKHSPPPIPWVKRDHWEEGKHLWQVTMGPYEGCYSISDGNWVHFICHSSHENDGLGNIIVARDASGALYMSDGHACGGIWLSSEKPVKTIEDFWETSTSADPNLHLWYPLEIPAVGPTD